MPEPPFTWVVIFLITCYLMGLACLYRCLRIGSVFGWDSGLREIGIFFCFCFTAYAVESWAHARTPYYSYAPEFPDRVPRLYVEAIPLYEEPPSNPCSELGKQEHAKLGGREIPLAVPILEGAMAFAALWTSRFLGAPVWLRPFFAGLVLVNIDALIDPIVATTYMCDGTTMRQGLGLWRWYIDETAIAHWYGIPLFNFAGWFCAAVLLVSFAHLIGWGKDAALWWAPKFLRPVKPVGRPPWTRLALWISLVCAPAFMLWISPSAKDPQPRWVQWVAMVGVLGGTALVVKRYARGFKTGRTEQTDLIRPLFLPVAFGLFALIASGQFLSSPTFLLAALATTSLGVLLCWWPYQDAVCGFAQRLVDLDRFIRLHYLGYPWMLVLLGAALAQTASFGAAQIVALLAIALCFHIHSCVLNDVIDLEIDKEQIRRQNDPLVRGDIGRTTAHVFALIQLPIIAILCQLLRGDGLTLALMAGACLLMGIYNWCGKRSPVPPLTDLVQGIAWGTLALCGAAATGEIGPVAWIVFAYGAGFMTLINGVHGGLRDLANDVRQKRTNTAHFLGAKPSRDDPYTVHSAWAVVVFAFAVQTFLLGLLGWELYRNHVAYDWLTRVIVAVALVAIAIPCHVFLWRLVRPGRARRDEAGSMHAFIILLPVLVVFWPALGPVMRVVVPLCFFVPLLVQFVDPIVSRVYPTLRGRLHAPPEKSLRAGLARSFPRVDI